MFGELNNSEIEEVLRRQIVGRISCHADGVTYVVPISYAYEDNYIYFHSYEGMKLTMMRKNPVVCFQTDIMGNMGKWKSVICWGEFEELKDETTRQKGIQILTDRHFPMVSSDTIHLSTNWPFRPDPSSVKGVVFRIRLEKKTGRFEDNLESSPVFL